MQFHIAKAAATTGATLRALVTANLQTEGHTDTRDAHICYGVGYTGTLPALNAHCSRHSKLEQSRLLQEGLGLASLQTYDATGPQVAEVKRLMNQDGKVFLARNLIHSKGTDIRVLIEPWQVDAAIQGGAGFFTQYEDSTREFRTWVYRKRHLGTYEKVLRRPTDYKRLGRNHQNGFDFSGLENDNVPEALKDVARRAIRTLGLDFGAVDILFTGPTNRYVVLEVNSAPGVSDERRKVIQSLAKRVSRWMVNGCPAREE